MPKRPVKHQSILLCTMALALMRCIFFKYSYSLPTVAVRWWVSCLYSMCINAQNRKWHSLLLFWITRNQPWKPALLPPIKVNFLPANPGFISFHKLLEKHILIFWTTTSADYVFSNYRLDEPNPDKSKRYEHNGKLSFAYGISIPFYFILL